MSSPASATSAAFLASTGTGTTCSQVAPCVSMDTAIGVAGVGGEVVCLDKFKYGSASNITTSVTISCGDGLWDTSLPFVNINTPANSKVVIEGLVGDCLGLTCSTIINFSGQGDLELRRVSIGHSGGSSAHGLLFAPNGPASLQISDSYFYDMPLSGVLVKPASGGSANVHIRNTHFARNQNGLFVDGNGSSIGINVNILGGASSGNTGNGFGAATSAGQAPVNMSIMNARISGNFANGLGAAGAGAKIMVGSSMITSNVNGVLTINSGQVLTYGNNQLQVNGSDGSFSGPLALR